MKKKVLIIFVIFILLFITLIIWYYYPISVYKELTVCSYDGEKMNVIIDVQWHRHLLYPTELKGSVSLDGVMFGSYLGFTDESGYNHPGYYDNKPGFWEGLIKKIKNQKFDAKFFIPKDNVLDLHKDYINLDVSDSDFNMICIYGTSNNKKLDYYGPAKTIEEVKSIEIEMYK